MTEKQPLGNSVAPLRNVMALEELVERVRGRSYGLPGMAVFYGFSGYGKTTAATHAANTFNAYYVQLKSVWTKKTLVEAILTDLGIPPRRNIADMVHQISEEIARTGRPLLIDEADYLVNRNMVELVRDIYESSEATIILIGEEQLPVKLQQWERFHGRMLDWVPAEPADSDDARLLARLYCPDVEISEDLLAMLTMASNGSIRRICVNLDRLREFARTRGLRELDRRLWDGGFFDGLPPKPRGRK